MCCAVLCDTPAEAASAATPAGVLPPACFMAASPACSRSVVMPADAASAGSCGRAGDLPSPAAGAFGGAGLGDGEPEPAGVPNTASAICCAVLCDTPAEAASAAIPAGVLPPACFMAGGPALRRAVV